MPRNAWLFRELFTLVLHDYLAFPSLPLALLLPSQHWQGHPHTPTTSPAESIFISNCQNILPSLAEQRACSAGHGCIPKCAKLLADLFREFSLFFDGSRCLITILKSILLQTLGFLDGKANTIKNDVLFYLPSTVFYYISKMKRT